MVADRGLRVVRLWWKVNGGLVGVGEEAGVRRRGR